MPTMVSAALSNLKIEFCVGLYRTRTCLAHVLSTKASASCMQARHKGEQASHSFSLAGPRDIDTLMFFLA